MSEASQTGIHCPQSTLPVGTLQSLTGEGDGLWKRSVRGGAGVKPGPDASSSI